MIAEDGSQLLTFTQELLRCDVGLTSAETRGHMDRLLPRKTIHSGCTIVADLARG